MHFNICLACIVVILCVYVYLFCICYTLCLFVVSYVYLLYLMCICCIYVYLLYSYVYLLYYVCIDILTLDAGLLARSQYPESPATGHLCLQANAEMVPQFPSCYYMPLM